MKYPMGEYAPLVRRCRSREGAWIEIDIPYQNYDDKKVAPARERGLKSAWPDKERHNKRRSREGAWIEIAY